MIFSGPIENKVQASSLWALGASVGVAVLNAVATRSELLGNLPPPVQFVILAAIPPAVTFLAGYVAPHTPRPEIYTYAEPAQPWLPEAPVVNTAPFQAPPPPYHDEPYGANAYNGPPPEPYANVRGRHRA
uniref:hypothetical protein n=1 Tax=Pseudonocardia sp. CA-138482 TaxID=3240023 RepID=UPI003F493E94